MIWFGWVCPTLGRSSVFCRLHLWRPRAPGPIRIRGIVSLVLAVRQRGLDIPNVPIPMPLCVIGSERAAGAVSRSYATAPVTLVSREIPRPTMPPVPIIQVLPRLHLPPLPQPVATPAPGQVLQNLDLGTSASADECCTCCEGVESSVGCAWYRSSPIATNIASRRTPTANGRT